MKQVPKIAFIICILLATAVSALAQGRVPQTPGKNRPLILGVVESVNPESITLTDKFNRTKSQVAVDQATPVRLEKGQNSRLEAVKIKDMVAIIADPGSTPAGQFRAQKIFVRPATESAQLRRRAVMGVITAINGNTITVSHQTRANISHTVVITDQTVIKSKSFTTKTTEEGEETAPVLALGQRIAAIGQVSDASLIAKLIHIIPGLPSRALPASPLPSPSPESD